jgi:NADH-quinone oxidoreductase subunit N
MDFMAIGTEIGIALLGFLALVVDLMLPKRETRKGLACIMLLGLLAILFFGFTQYHQGGSLTFFHGLYFVDNYALFFKQLFVTAMLFTVLFSQDYVQTMLRYRGEFYAMLMFALLGMCVLSSANDFLMAFIGLELMTISFYVLVGARLTSADSSEAAVKYLIIGASSSAVMLFGISLVYGTTGSIIFADICRNPHIFYATGIAGVTMVLIGFFFKLSVIPFHMWAPDVYEGAPAPVSAILAMGSKAAALAVIMRVLFTAFPMLGGYWLPIIAVLSAVCMIGGNAMAIVQKDVKRMLAYSSIAQVGYMLVGVASADAAGMKAVLFYAALYVFANVGAFAVLSVIENQKGKTDREHIAGLAKSAPILAAVMTVSLLSMAGIPPTAGFAGKIYLFTAVVEQGGLWLAFVGFIMSMISVYYYLLVVKAMYLGSNDGKPVLVSGAMRATVVLSALATLGIGIYPEQLAQLTDLAAFTFMH